MNSNHIEEAAGTTVAVVYHLCINGACKVVGFGLHEILIVINAGLAGLVGGYMAHVAKKIFNSK